MCLNLQLANLVHTEALLFSNPLLNTAMDGSAQVEDAKDATASEQSSKPFVKFEQRSLTDDAAPKQVL